MEGSSFSSIGAISWNVSFLQTLNPAKSFSTEAHSEINTAGHIILEAACRFLYRHRIPCTRNVENCIFDSVRALKFLYCSFVIHKLEKEISPITTLHILYDPCSLGCIRASRLKEIKEQKYFPTTLQIYEGWCAIIK